MSAVPTETVPDMSLMLLIVIHMIFY